jgi:hypothetical protein
MARDLIVREGISIGDWGRGEKGEIVLKVR